jgi:hypothetical protein
MNVTKDVINDLIPLYAEKECSADTCELVEEYLRAHPEQAEELQRIMKASLPGAVPSPVNSDEVLALKKARRLVRLRGWVMGFAIFFSLAPFSILHTGNKTYVLFLEAPATALGYGLIGLVCWLGYAFMRSRSQAL